MKRIISKIENNKKKNKRIVFIIVILFVLFFIIGIRKFPKIKEIDVIISTSSNDEKELKLTKEEIINNSGLKIGDKLYRYLRSEIAKNIEQIPYVNSVNIERNINGKIILKVIQREPKYLINYAGNYIYIDKDAYILEINSNNIEKPILIGLMTDFSNISIGDIKVKLNKEDFEKIQIVNNMINIMEKNEFTNKINSIDLTDRNNFIIHFDDDGKTVYLGDETDLNTKVLYIKKIIQKEVGNNGEIYVNGNLDEGYVYFKEQ